MPILIKPLLYILAFGETAVIFANVIGLACWLLIMCVRAIAWRLTAISNFVATLTDVKSNAGPVRSPADANARPVVVTTATLAARAKAKAIASRTAKAINAPVLEASGSNADDVLGACT